MDEVGNLIVIAEETALGARFIIERTTADGDVGNSCIRLGAERSEPQQAKSNKAHSEQLGRKLQAATLDCHKITEEPAYCLVPNAFNTPLSRPMYSLVQHGHSPFYEPPAHNWARDRHRCCWPRSCVSKEPQCAALSPPSHLHKHVALMHTCTVPERHPCPHTCLVK